MEDPGWKLTRICLGFDLSYCGRRVGAHVSGHQSPVLPVGRNVIPQEAIEDKEVNTGRCWLGTSTLRSLRFIFSVDAVLSKKEWNLRSPICIPSSRFKVKLPCGDIKYGHFHTIAFFNLSTDIFARRPRCLCLWDNRQLGILTMMGPLDADRCEAITGQT